LNCIIPAALFDRLVDAYYAFRQGGWVMIPLLICSIVAVTIAVELAIVLRRRSIIPRSLRMEIEEMTSAADAERVLKRMEKTPCPFANVMRAGLISRRMSRLENQEQLLLAGRQESHMLERGLIALEIIAAIAPLLGLLGTVLGMVQVFDVISKEGPGRTATLSAGIKQALYTTVVGLTVAIPSLIAHSYFSKRVDDLVLEIEKFSAMLLNKLYGPSPEPDGKGEKT